jgi:hypothetical protein
MENHLRGVNLRNPSRRQVAPKPHGQPKHHGNQQQDRQAAGPDPQAQNELSMMTCFHGPNLARYSARVFIDKKGRSIDWIAGVVSQVRIVT